MIPWRKLLEEEREQFSLFLPVFMGLGILEGVFFPFFSFLRLAVHALGCLILACLFKSHRIRTAIALVALGTVIAQTGGIFGTNLVSLKQFLQEDVKKVGFNADVGFIEETHPTMRGMQRLILKNLSFGKRDQKLSFIKTVKMTCSSKMLQGIQPRDSVRVFGTLTRFKDPVIPGSFDQKQYNTVMGIDANGVIFSIRKISPRGTSDFMEIFSSLRFKLTQLISKKIAGEASGICAALLTGDKSAIKPETRENFIMAGIAHLLAISGLHMGLVAGIIFFLLKRIFLYLSNFFQKIRPNVIASLATIPFSFVYLALSGFSPSASRSFIMTSIMLISQASGKKAISLKNISIAGFLILLFSPFSLFHLSFQMSFSAVVALISFYEKFQKFITKNQINKIFRYLIFSLATTVIATAATAPISIATFNRFSSQNLLGNIIAVPITSFLIAPLGIANLILGSFTDFLIPPLETSVNLVLKSAAFIASLPGSNLALKTPDIFVFYITILGGVLLCLLKTKLRHIGSVLITGCLCHYCFLQKIPEIIWIPGEEGICCQIQDGVLFSTSKKKARNKIKAIAKNLGLDEDNIKKLEEPPFKISENYETGLFIWEDKTVKTLSIRKHPVCPILFSRVSIAK